MKKFTVCLYDGSVTRIDNIVATKTIEAEGIDSFDHIALFYDMVKTDEYKNAIYRNRITKKCFTVYYERTICLNDKIHTYDFGSYTRFIAVFEGDHYQEDLQKILYTAYHKK